MGIDHFRCTWLLRVSVSSPKQVALQTLSPVSDIPEALDQNREEDVQLIARLTDMLGEFFSSNVVTRGDHAWATGMVQSVHS